MKPMNAELYGSILLYTSNAAWPAYGPRRSKAIYKQLNKALREEDRDQVQPLGGTLEHANASGIRHK